MARELKPTNPIVRAKAGVDSIVAGDVALVSVSGLVDEHFTGFGAIGEGIRTVVINVAQMTRMTSFGVRQWLKGMDAMPKAVTDLYLLGCPTFFVDQLNMVLNFGGSAQVLTVVAPYTCPSCGVESGETIDVLADRAVLAKGGVSDKICTRCGGKLEFDETPESYFSFVGKYAASSIAPPAAQLLSSQGLYTSVVDTSTEKPPKIIKLVHGSVTYFKIIGAVGAMFRARPFLVGAEGEVVIDLAEVERFDQLGQREWRRLLKTLSGQVPSITLVDLNEVVLEGVGDSLTMARNISVSSLLASYKCNDCGRVSAESQTLDGMGGMSTQLPEGVCSTCGGVTASTLQASLSPLQKVVTAVPPASAKLIAQRTEILSRAMTDANVAQAGDNATASLSTDDTILGKYKIVRRLSQGGMAEVFLAKQVGIGGFEKPVALKRIQRQLLETRHLAVDMFLNEAKIAGRLMHPNIVQVHDVGEVGGALYLAMEYVRGKDLREIIKTLRSTRAMIPLPIALYVVREVAQALHHAYWSSDMAGNLLAVVHRDVSPHNIILSFDGAVKLLDFGVAMSAVTEQTETMIVGKWQYMSPEHTTNQAIDHRSDLFSLGVILYLLCTANLPFVGSDLKDVVRKIRAGNYLPLKEAAPDIPDALAQLVSSMLSPNPDDRVQKGSEVAATLTEIARSYGMDVSGATISTFMNETFAAEGRGESGAIEIVRPPVSAPSRQAPRREIEQRATKLGIGAQVAPPASPNDEHLRATPEPTPQLAQTPLSSASFPAAFPHGSISPNQVAFAPTGSFAINRRSQDLAVPTKLGVGWTPMRIAFLAIGLAIVALLTYFVAGSN